MSGSKRAGAEAFKLARRLALYSTLLLPSALCACSSATNQPKYDSEIRRTAWGVPHVLAQSLAGVAFGQGYAYAEDRACVLADQVVKIESRRAAWLGRGEGDVNIDTDFAYLALDLYAHAHRALDSQPAESREMIAGYVAGFNAFLANGTLPSDCRDAGWVHPLSELDLMAHMLDVALVGVPRVLLPNIGHAKPPQSSSPPQAFSPHALELNVEVPASNGWAIGGSLSSSGSGMLVANPHFPWEGDLELYENHLQVPGLLDVYGVTIGGVPGVLLGFNRHLAWTHTVSAATQTLLYSLALSPQSPTSYRYGDGYREMTSHEYSVKYLDDAGATHTEKRVLYQSHYGPIVDAPLIGWSALRTTALKTTALSNYSVVAQYLRNATANTIEAFRSAQADEQGTQWANSLAVDDQGTAFYCDAARVPLLAEQAGEAFDSFRKTDVYAGIYGAEKVTLVDGANPIFEWRSDGVGPHGDVSPFSRAPALERTDFLFNANESYWLSQPDAPLEGRVADGDPEKLVPFSFLYGPKGSARSPRTRINARLLMDRSQNAPIGADGLFSLAELKTAILSNRSLLAEELLAPLVERCRTASSVELNGNTVDLDAACDALSAWNGRYDPDAGAGALVFREFLAQFSDADLRDTDALFAEPFDPARPIETPSGLAPAPAQGADPILAALAAAVVNLRSFEPQLASITLAQAQHAWRASELLPVHGCQEREGCPNVVRTATGFNTSSLTTEPQTGKLVNAETNLTQDGYTINHGTSYLLALEFREDGPHAEALLTYGEGASENSPHYRDQLELFWQKQLRPVLFEEAAIQADPELERTCLHLNDGGLTRGCP